MKIVVILILGYFALGFYATSFTLQATLAKPKKPNPFRAETPPFQTPLLLTLAGGFLALPLLGYRRALKQGTFLRFGVKFWLYGPSGLFAAGVATALILWFAAPSLFTS
ncbi:MAG TPA: hypothetical protein VF950_15945 [Planctomycetota bacterium]